jgi:hypothetical protein
MVNRAVVLATFGEDRKLVFTIETSTEEVILLNSPNKWNESNYNYTRNRESMAVIRSFSNSIEFDGVARDIINSYVPNKLNENVYINIYKCDSSTFVYSLDYRGRIDFNKYSDDGVYVSI